MARSRLLAAAVLAVAAASGCGPVAYVLVTRHASSSIDKARAAQADKYAPYWWTRATQYFHKAKEIAAHADFQGANRFGRLAAEAADQAAADAALAAKEPSKRPVDPDNHVAPAKDEP